MKFEPVNTKLDFVKRYQQGEFGNRAPTWNGISEFLRGDPPYKSSDLIHLRNRKAGGPTWYDVKAEDVEEVYMQIVNTKLAEPQDIYLSAMAPTPDTLFQGEIFLRDDGILNLFASTVAKPMRESLKEGGKSYEGIIAWLLLKHFLCPNSQEWILELLRRYPGHVIEFSTYAKRWGTLSNFNTVFWEVRNY